MADAMDTIFDAVLEYLKDKLPSPVFALLFNLLAHGLAFIQALYSLTAAMLAKNPADWDTQTVLPPFIAFLAAYLALMSAYRTTTFMIRTGMFFVKWGVILTVVAGGFGWMMGTQQTSRSSLVDVAMDFINSANDNTPRTSSRSSARHPPKRPHVWESFERHRDWRERREQAREAGGFDALAMIGKIAEWWDQAKEAVTELPAQAEGDTKTMRGRSSSPR